MGHLLIFFDGSSLSPQYNALPVSAIIISEVVLLSSGTVESNEEIVLC